jgi:phage terminase large subunit-like protein
MNKRVKAYCREFGQQAPRLKADKQLQDLILGGKIAHDSNPLLRRHVDNADIVRGGREGVRIVKRSDTLKVDGAVALSMACERCLYFNVGR